MTRPRALLGGIMVAAVLLLLAVPARIEAHAAYVRSDPPADAVLRVAPARVTVWFSEPLAVALSRIEVRDTTNARVDNGDSTGDPADPMRLSVGVRPLANGTYTVVWNNVSTLDGHPLRGSFVFHVGDSPTVETTSTTAPAALASPIDPWIRWIALLSAVAATGGLLFEAAVLRPAVQHTHSREPVRVAVTEIHRVLSRGRVAASAVFLGSALLQVVAQASVVAGVAVWALAPVDVIDVVRYTGWGQLWLARVLLALLAVVAPLAARRLPRASEAWLTEVVPFLATLAALSTFSLSSHGAATADLAFPGALTDYVHLLAAAVWVGGLLALLPTLVLLRRLLPADDRRPLLASIAERFTTIAAPAVGVVLLTGVYSGWLQLRSFEAVTTPYGLALAAKTTLVGVLLLLGAANLLWVRPLLARAERAAAASAWLHRFVATEVAAAILVMLAVGLITSLEPARQVQERITGGGLHASQEAAGTRIDVTVQPGTPGLNRVLLTITDRRGQHVTNATAVVVRPRYLDADLGATEVNATPTPDGRYEVQRVPLSIAGAWEVQVTVTRPGAGDATVAPRFAVSATPPPPRTDAELGRTLWSWLVLGVGLVVLVLAPRAWSGRLARSRMRILATTVVMIGVVLVYGAHSHGGPQQQQATGTNPVPGGPQAVEVGRLLYQQQCASCHGISGLGDGPQAAGLQPPPADLRLHTPLHPDSQIYAFISQGFPGSAMPAFAGRLTDTQMWNLVHYLRSITTPATQ